MAVSQKIQPNKNISSPVRAWHDVFRPSWEYMTAVGYVPAVSVRQSTFYMEGLANSSGEVSLLGDDAIAAHARQLPVNLTNISFYVVSDDAADTGTVRINAVDEEGDEKIFIITMTGVTPVLISNAIMHVNFAMYQGGEAMNTGHIVISTKSSAGTPAIIVDEVQLVIREKSSHGTNPKQLTPNNQVYAYCDASLTADKNDGVHFRLYNRMADGNTMLAKQWLVYASSYSEEFCVPLAVAAGEYLEVTADRSASGTGSINLSANLTVMIMNPDDVAIPGGARGEVNGLFRPV